MSLLKFKAEAVFNRVNDTVNLLVKQGYGSLEQIANMDSDDLEGLKSVNELLNESQEYFVKQAEELDNMSDKLEDLQKQMKEMNSKIELLLEKVDKD